ncbi:Uncharacterised protein [Vibrio cholerae]|nr:Uncharacterised protein [Vibrio cholerae]
MSFNLLHIQRYCTGRIIDRLLQNFGCRYAVKTALSKQSF